MRTLPDIETNPDYGLTETPEYSLDETDFGDGYTQVRPRGINAERRVWELTWSRLTKEESDILFDFLRDTKGAEKFYWVHPDSVGLSVPLKVRCKNPKRVYNSFNAYTVTATFREDFGL